MEGMYQAIVKLIDGEHKALDFTTPSISILSVKTRIFEFTSIPIHHQLLTSHGKLLTNETLISSNSRHHFPTINLSIRLCGGKGGFGSLLRGAATKAGQKKTNNFDACRDMSGRRLRHVNAEKKLEEWKAEAEERRLEKIADEFIKKKAKEVRKEGGRGGGDGAEKYVEKYRKDSIKCMEEVDKTVREAIGNSKRKGVAVEGNGSETSKRLKMWIGKRKLDGSDSDDTDDDSSGDEMTEENEKSVVINNGNHSDSNKESGRSLGSVTGKLDGESSVGCSSESGSEEEETVVNRILASREGPNEGTLNQGDGLGQSALLIREEGMVENKDVSWSEVTPAFGIEVVQAEVPEFNKTGSGNMEEIVCQPLWTSNLGESGASDAEANRNSDLKTVVDEKLVGATNNVELEKPLTFDEFTLAAEMEVLGMERLKSELQARGLKCGGTLQERAARLFLLKTTPLEKLPKKLLAKK